MGTGTLPLGSFSRFWSRCRPRDNWGGPLVVGSQNSNEGFGWHNVGGWQRSDSAAPVGGFFVYGAGVYCADDVHVSGGGEQPGELAVWSRGWHGRSAAGEHVHQPAGDHEAARRARAAGSWGRRA